MYRHLALALFALAAAGCKFDAPGQCTTSADCTGSLPCVEGVCSHCRTSTDCAAWEACSTDALCEPVVGRCNLDTDCESWEECDATHTCVVRAGHCPWTQTCEEWESCDTEHHCVLNDGRCWADGDCGTFTVCDATHTCNVDSTGGRDVFLWGTFSPGTCGVDAVSPVLHPERAVVGFDCYTNESGVVTPAGDLLYASDTKVTVVRLVADRLQRTSGHWDYPTDPEANDPIMIDPGSCDVAGWAVQAGTGALISACWTGTGSAKYFYVSSGAEVPGVLWPNRVHSWNAGDYKLVSYAGSWDVVDPAGASVSVTGLGSSDTITAWRATATGFRVATISTADGVRRWAIGPDGVAVLEGVHSSTLTGHHIYAPSAIDGAGNLYATGWVESDSAVEEVFRLPLQSAPVVVVYSEANAPANANDWYSVNFNPYVFMHGGFSSLVTPP